MTSKPIHVRLEVTPEHITVLRDRLRRRIDWLAEAEARGGACAEMDDASVASIVLGYKQGIAELTLLLALYEHLLAP